MKILQKLSYLLLSGLLLVSCGEKPTVHPDDEGGNPPIIVEAPRNIIPVQEAENMYHRYGTERVPLIEASVNIDKEGNPIPPEDPNYVQATRSLSMDYTALKQYLAFIEQEAKNSKTDISGLRIYFSKYPSGKNDSRASVFLNPIMEYGKKGDLRDDVSFAIQRDGGKSIAVPVGSIVKVPVQGSNKADLTMPVQGTIQSLAGNDFPWTPPPNNNSKDFQ